MNLHRHWTTVGALMLPGLLFGAKVAGLLFFLNPDLPFRPWTVLRGSLAYGALGAAASVVVLGLVTRGRSRAARRALPWAVMAVLALGAAFDWIYAARYDAFLPAGIITRMLKEAVILTLASLVVFYTALLHTVHERPYGARSRWGLALVTALALFAMVERREAFRPPLPEEPFPSAVGLIERPRLVVIAADGVGLNAILPLVEHGQLPNIARLLRRGARARVRPVAKRAATPGWVTVASGKLPSDHGVVTDRTYPATAFGEGELRLLPRGIGFSRWGTFGAETREVVDSDRAVLTLWEILDRLGARVGVVGWPTVDADTSEGAFLIDHNYFTGRIEEVLAGPGDLAARGALFRVEPEDLEIREILERPEPVPLPLLEVLAENQWRQELTRFLLNQHPDVDVLFVRLRGLERMSRRYYGGFAAAQLEGSTSEADRSAARWVEVTYRHLDEFIGALLEEKPGPKLVAVVSTRSPGIPGPGLRLWNRLRGRGTYARERPLDGVFLLAGPGVRGDRALDRAAAIDIAPTLLYALGLPVARDMPGRVLTEAFDNGFLATHPVAVVPSYETLGGTAEADDPLSFLSR